MANQRTLMRIAIAIATLITFGFHTSEAQSNPTTNIQLTLIFLYSIIHPVETIKEISKLNEQERNMELRRLAIKQCEAEARELPETFDIDEFVDEGASLRTTLLLKLLIDRQVRAIYVRPIKESNAWRIARPDGGMDSIWRAADSTLGYVKLEFGYRSSGKCLPEKQMPIYQWKRFDSPPFLMDSCITATYVDKPSARYALRYAPSKNVLGKQFGYWTISDLESNRSIAQLTTVDDPTTPSSENYHHCGAPYSSLADRIKPLTNSKFRPVTVKNTKVTPNIFPGEIEASFGELPSVIPAISNTTFSSDEEGYLFNWMSSVESWRKTITEAKREKIGHYGERLLDLDRQELKSLKTSSDDRYGWEVTALQNGFMVFSANWRRGDSNLLARYDAQGRLEWAVKVVDTLDGCSIRPRSAAVIAASDSIILYGLCKQGQGTSWTIKKSSISPKGLP